MVERHGVSVDESRLAEWSQAHQVKRLAFFGSFLREDFGPESDIDLLIEFLPGARVSLFGIVRMEMELSDMLGRKVDLRTPEDLSRHFRDQVLASAEVCYAA
jgi:uncharacterized protein